MAALHQNEQGITTGPRTFHRFWPRLCYSAQPLGTEARKAKQKGNFLLRKVSERDDIDTRLFVRGGPWIAQHLSKLVAEDSVEWKETATCVMLMGASKLAKKHRPGLEESAVLQGTLKSMKDNKRCFLRLARVPSEGSDSEEESTEIGQIADANLTSPDIWWCLPYWVAAEYSLHSEKIPVKEGFYFLGSAGSAFCVVTVNWNQSKFSQDVRIDGKLCSEDWFLLHDHKPRCVRMFETAVSSRGSKGRSLVFAQRASIDSPSDCWEQAAGVSGKVSTSFWEFSEEGEEGGDAENEIETRDSHDEEESKMEAEGKAEFSTEDEAIKADSELEGPKGVKFGGCTWKAREKLGTKEAHYRAPAWFAMTDTMLQEASMQATRRKESAGITAEVSTPEGATKEATICFDKEEAAARLQERPGPIRNSKFLQVNFHRGKRGDSGFDVVEVPKTHSIATVKENVKRALADEDVFGEAIWTSRLKWTFVRSDGNDCEVNISVFTEAANLNSVAALHVYIFQTQHD